MIHFLLGTISLFYRHLLNRFDRLPLPVLCLPVALLLLDRLYCCDYLLRSSHQPGFQMCYRPYHHFHKISGVCLILFGYPQRLRYHLLTNECRFHFCSCYHFYHEDKHHHQTQIYFFHDYYLNYGQPFKTPTHLCGFKIIVGIFLSENDEEEVSSDG